MKRNATIIVLPLALILGFLATDVSGATVLDTKHNLSVTSPGPIKATLEDRVCIFCHSSPKSRMAVGFLWNRKNKTRTYKPYQSSTLQAKVGQPTGASRVCLSCHDGTIALGGLISERREIPFRGGIRFMPKGLSRLGTDLSDDHPVSLVYDSSLAAKNRELIPPAALPSDVKLDKERQLQCTSCHDPHDDTYGNFLVMPNVYSDLCTTCHRKEGWAESFHALSSVGWNGQGPDPWPNTDYQSVAENGCENCHSPHTAGGHERLLKHAFEEDNCLMCHNGNVASSDISIEKEITKPYGHLVQNYTGLHDAAEDFTSGEVPKHVECEDCHNPHQVNGKSSPGAPAVSGANDGVMGIGSGGNLVARARNLYEICFKCHADHNVLAELPITREIDQLNTRLEFSSSNPSFHPLEAAGVNPDVPSLLPPYTSNSMISCTHCHNTDDTTGVRGPHGSSYRFILERNYSTADYTPETPENYALCYKCHNRNSILNDESFKEHRRHIVDQQAPCAICHDPHGISDIQGNSTNNSHLMNFDVVVVRQDNEGRREFQDLGRFSGQCFLVCHGQTMSFSYQ